jgi:hypothetical protein
MSAICTHFCRLIACEMKCQTKFLILEKSAFFAEQLFDKKANFAHAF